MNYQMDYFYGHEANQFTFFRIPKLLFSDERFIGLTSDAKILYGLMLDRRKKKVSSMLMSEGLTMKSREFLFRLLRRWVLSQKANCLLREENSLLRTSQENQCEYLQKHWKRWLFTTGMCMTNMFPRLKAEH